MIKQCSFFLLLVTGLTVYSQTKLKTSALNIFKNGTYFVVKEGTVPLKDKKAKLEIPKGALMSTFWMTTTKDNNIEKVVFMNDTINKTKPAVSIPDLLSINKGKRVKLYFRIENNKYYDITGVLQDYSRVNNLIKLKTDDGKTSYLGISDIKQLDIDEAPNEKVKADSVAYLANIEFGRNTDNVNLKMVYMQTGIQWLPSYNIKLLNEKELQLEMRALVENFMEKINDADLTLTVGDPYFRYGRATEPFIYNYLTAITGIQPSPVNRYAYQNVASPSMSQYATPLAEESSYQYNDYTTYTTEGEKTNDLYMYNLGKVSIPMNSKASFMIFSQKIPYKDVYTVNIGDVINYCSTKYINNDPNRKYNVFHSLKLENTSKNPLTTAPVFILDENLQPLAQDEIKYTPVGGDVSVQLSNAVDVRIKNSEEEVKVVERAKVESKVVYNKVTIKGTIEVNNLQDKKINLNLYKDINAKVIEASHNGVIKKSGRYSGLNPFTQINWEIPVEKNEKVEINYQYEVFVYGK
jgi:cytoskeletal protein CcmA (bactofilin family)